MARLFYILHFCRLDKVSVLVSALSLHEIAQKYSTRKIMLEMDKKSLAAGRKHKAKNIYLETCEKCLASKISTTLGRNLEQETWRLVFLSESPLILVH